MLISKELHFGDGQMNFINYTECLTVVVLLSKYIDWCARELILWHKRDYEWRWISWTWKESLYHIFHNVDFFIWKYTYYVGLCILLLLFTSWKWQMTSAALMTIALPLTERTKPTKALSRHEISLKYIGTKARREKKQNIWGCCSFHSPASVHNPMSESCTKTMILFLVLARNKQ